MNAIYKKTNILTEIDLATKYIRKGERHLMKETGLSVNSLPVAEKKSWLCSVSLAIKDKRSKYKGKFTHKWINYGR